MATLPRKAFRFGALALGVALLLTLWLAQSDWVKRRALARVQASLRQQGIELQAASLDYDLLRLQVTIHGLELSSARRNGLPPFATFRDVRARLHWNTLKTLTLDLDSAEIDGAAVRIVFDAAGRSNLPQLPPSRGPAPRWLMRSLRVPSGSFQLEDRQHALTLNLEAWDLTLEGSPATGEHQVAFRANRAGQVLYQGRRVSLDQLAVNGSFLHQSFNVTRAEWKSGASEFLLRGRIDGNALALHSEARLDLPELARLVGRPESIAGVLNVVSTATGPLNDLLVATKVSGKELRYETYEDVALTAEASYSPRNQTVRLTQASVRSPVGEATAMADVALRSGRSNLAAQFSRLNVGALAKSFRLPLEIDSAATMQLQAEWPALDVARAAADGVLRLRATRDVVVAKRLPVTAEIEFRGGLNDVSLQVRSVSALGVEGIGTLRLAKQQDLSGDFSLGTDSIAGAVKQANTLLKKSWPTEQVDGRVAVSGTLGGNLSAPTLAAEVRGEALKAGPVASATMEAGLSYADQVLTVSDLQANWQGQLLRADGALNLSDQQLRFLAFTEKMRLEKLVASSGEGALQLRARGSGTLASPAIALELTGEGLRSYGEELGALRAEAEFTNDRLKIAQFRMPRLDLSGQGSYQLSDGSYSLEAKSGGAPLSYGRFAGTASGRGTLSNPQFQAQIETASFQVDGRIYGPLRAGIQVKDQAALVTAEARDYAATATATIDTKAPYATTFSATAAKVPLDFDPRMSGAVKAQIEGRGELERWADGTATLTADLLDVRWNGEPVTLREPLRAALTTGFLQLKPLTLLMPGTEVTIEGGLPVKRRREDGALKVRGQIDLAALPKLVPDWDSALGTSGTLELIGAVKGGLDRLDPTATVTLRDGTVLAAGRNPVSDLQLEATLRDGLLRLERLSGTWAKAQVKATGEFPLGLLPADLAVEIPRRTGMARLTVDTQGLDLSVVEGVPQSTSGTMALHLEVEADKAELGRVRGSATVEELQVRLGEITLEQASKSTILLADGTARIESMSLRGPGTELTLRGRAGLVGDYPIALRLAGNLETGSLAALMAPAKMRGAARLQLSAYGPARALKAAGFLEWSDGQILLAQPRIAAENVQTRVEFTGEQLSIARLTGSLNGGTVSAKGGLRYSGGEARDIDVSVDAKNVYLDYPFGLRTLSDAALSLKQAGRRITLGGKVDIKEGSFRELVTIEGNLLSLLNSPAAAEASPEERNAYLERTQFDVRLRTESPLLIRNNLAKAGVNLDARLAGSYYQPALLGRLTMEEGGQLYFAERSYAVERGIVTFTNEQKIDPTFDILARTRVASHDVSLLIAGGGGDKLSTTLSSDPALPEQDIVAMLVTGKSPEEFKNSDTATLASRQALSYFAGSFGSRFTRQIERATGLSTVRVEPDLIANESNPTARLTIGQDLSPFARLIYSMNLANGGDQIYVAEYDITKRFTTRGVKQVDNTYRFEFRHDLRFGGERTALGGQAPEQRVVGKVEVPGNGFLSEQKIRDTFKNKSGKKYDFFEIRKGLDRLEKLHRDAGLLEARVRVEREVRESVVDLKLEIDAGPELRFVYEGWEPGSKFRKQVRQIWQEGVFDAQRLDDASRLLRTELIQEGYLEGKVDAKVDTSGQKRVTFDIQPGAKYGALRFEFPGANQVELKELEKILKHRDARTAALLTPTVLRDLVQSHYREQGYLDVATKSPVVRFSEGQAVAQIAVAEGRRYEVGGVRFAGNTAIASNLLAERSEIKVDEPYRLPLRQVSITQIRELYLAAGFPEVQVNARTEREGGKVNLTYQIEEGPREVLQQIEITGNDATSAALIKSQLALKEGEALEPAKLAESRRNLYSTGAYSLVDLERVPTGDVSVAGTKPMLLRAKVREVQPFDLRYGGYFDTERGPGAVVDFTNRNSLGDARAIGGRLRYDADFREGRVFFSQPLLRRFPLQSIFSGFVNRSLLPTFVTDRVGVSAQQETRFKRRYLINYGYRLERVHTYEKVPNEFLPFDVTLRVAPLTFTMNRESRDDILDATKGSFVSHAFEWAPELLGSDVRFIRYYAQFFKYLALGKPTEIPLSGGVKKARLVYAGGARVGLARGLGGQELVVSERFFAGGGTTLRGFAQNTLGEKDFLGDPTGGSAVVLLNNELRFPMASIFDGVGFVDLGNTYRRAADFSLGDLRKAAGFGLRIRTPYFLIRLDYGFKLDRRPGESRGGFFFSIGQAF